MAVLNSSEREFGLLLLLLYFSRSKTYSINWGHALSCFTEANRRRVWVHWRWLSFGQDGYA